jgi:hypothetical protein
MKLSLPVLAAAVGLLAGGGAGSYWYLVHTESADAAPAAIEEHRAFIDMDRKFVVP